jgi:hypothetical protein
MRLWSIHPSYLDSIGLVALWREALLAKKVLSQKTKGYKHHPQLDRFKQQKNPVAAINAYLTAVYQESKRRGYLFDRRKIGQSGAQTSIKVTDGQLHFEIDHLKKKLWKRNRKKYFEIKNLRSPESHPLFRMIEGKVENWEKFRQVALRNDK